MAAAGCVFGDGRKRFALLVGAGWEWYLSGGYSLSTISETLGISRATVWRFLQSAEWKEFVLSVKGDKVLEEAIKYLRGYEDRLKFFEWVNAQSREDVIDHIRKRYPEVELNYPNGDLE